MEQTNGQSKGFVAKSLDVIERVGNKLPDPAILFFILLIFVWVLSAFMSNFSFAELDPRTGTALQVKNLLTGPALADFMANMVTTFTGFAPLGIVLVAMLGVGVAEHAGYINAGLKTMLGFTPKSLLTPMLILVAIVSHTATDAGYVLVIPIGGVIFYSVGRHPLAGIAAAFAGVSGGFSANFVPSGIDPLLQGFTQEAAQIIDPAVQLNPLNNWFFTAASSIIIILLGWYLTDKVVEPRLKSTQVDANEAELPKMEPLQPKEKSAFRWASLAMLAGLVAFALWTIPSESAMRETGISTVNSPSIGYLETVTVATGAMVTKGQEIAMMKKLTIMPGEITKTRREIYVDTPLLASGDGKIVDIIGAGSIINQGTQIAKIQGERSVTSFKAPIMRSIVPLIFIIFLIPGVVYGMMSGTFKTSKEIIESMTKSMSGMSYYIVMAFFCALFIDAFGKSNIGALLALKGAAGLKALALPGEVTIVGIVFLTAFVNLFVGSASAKWALIAPIMVPMLMQLNISPDLTQAAYRVGDSVSNIVTPLMPYFPLVVVFCQKYVKNTGIGTLVSMMLPYSVVFIVAWSLFLLLYWASGVPLGLQATYDYFPGQ
jgi:p-aminobenzoyl-glutamate transporter AbgT